MSESIIQTMSVLSDATIEAGIAGGKLFREGSVVRDVATGQIVKMLKEVTPEVANGMALRAPIGGQPAADIAKRVADAAKNNPKAAIGIGVGAVVVVGAVWGLNSIAANRKRRKAVELYEKLKEQDIKRAEKEAERMTAASVETEALQETSVNVNQAFDSEKFSDVGGVIEFDEYSDDKLA